ncbi:U2 small nuclear ribonucleoprotein A'-like [Clavelina lepadiformis]|uniref:U2A'/phosphoprotein 32 family A C-terminal domain-containing protein n=1 Tax=Clavelina lepadiformis TaxID=159417 RepID=A0ABP0GG69_CLALP
MVKLTPDLIEQAIQYINPVRDRELLLRGYKIPVIENMGATLDQFDTVDFSDNDIRKLDGFPLLPRIKALHFNNNRICRIGEDVHTFIPNLHELYLTNCEIRELSDLDSLTHFKKLEFLSLLRNPVTHRQHYRLYVIHQIPQVRVLDFRRVRLKERQESKKLFGSKQGKKLMTEIGKKQKTFVPGAPITSNGVEHTDGPSKADREAIKEAILKATSLEEVERLKQMLQAGQIPSKALPDAQNNKQAQEVVEVEMEEDD